MAAEVIERTRPWLLWAAVVIAWLGLVWAEPLLFFIPVVFLVAEWPRRPLTVLYDGDCAFCELTRKWMSRLDPFRMLEWRAYQSGAGREWGITDEQAAERVYLISGGKNYGGFAAFRMMILWNPLWYPFAAAALWLASPMSRAILAAGLVIFFSPVFSPVGEAIYRVIARNRGRLVRGSKCDV